MSPASSGDLLFAPESRPLASNCRVLLEDSVEDELAKADPGPPMLPKIGRPAAAEGLNGCLATLGTSNGECDL